jgi:hypothetical protein
MMGSPNEERYLEHALPLKLIDLPTVFIFFILGCFLLSLIDGDRVKGLAVPPPSDSTKVERSRQFLKLHLIYSLPLNFGFGKMIHLQYAEA